MLFHTPKMLKVLKSFIPPRLLERVKADWSFRPEDPNNLLQVLPQMDVKTSVERIKGFRYPAPGSRQEARVPIRESEDHVFTTNYYVRDPANINANNVLVINSSKKPALLSSDNPKLASHGKRKIMPLAYDSTGLRTTKTATWESLDKALSARAVPDHLPNPSWLTDYAGLEEDRAKKGLPLPMGKRFKHSYSSNYNEVRW